MDSSPYKRSFFGTLVVVLICTLLPLGVAQAFLFSDWKDTTTSLLCSFASTINLEPKSCTTTTNVLVRESGTEELQALTKFVAPTSTPPTIINEYVTFETTGVTTQMLEERLQAFASSYEPRTSYEPDVVIPPNVQAELDHILWMTRKNNENQSENLRAGIRESNSDTSTVSSLWSTSGLDISYTSGNVGIGTSTPSEILTLDGPMFIAPSSPADTSNRLYNLAGTLYWDGNPIVSTTTGQWLLNSGDAYRLTGSVGIGTSSPNGKLHIYSSSAGSATVNTNSDDLLIENSSDVGVTLLSPATQDGFITFADSDNSSSGIISYSHPTDALSFWTNSQQRMTIASSGFLGINVDSPTAMLAVQSTSTSDIVNFFETGGQEVFTLLESGNVGIGSTSPSSRLTVAGDISAATGTFALIDTGGQLCDVRAYGAVGDNSTLNDTAIANAIADCGEGGTVYFPMGEFRISQPIVLDTPVTLRGAYSPRWSYSSTPRSSIRADFGSFAGVAMVHVRDRMISGETNHNNGGRLEYLSLDGGSASTSVDGIYFEGLVRDWKLTDVDISQTTGNGFEAAVGNGEGNPRGFTIRGLSIYSADGHGFRATALNDSYIDDLLAVGNALRGIYLSSMGETKVANSRAVFNGLTGLYIDGSTTNGGISFTDFSTDRNDRHGVRISASGTSTIIFNGLLTRRDGPNTSGGTETPYAGVAIIGSSTEKVAPVFISGLGQTIGVDDFDNPPLAPLVGVRVTNAEYVKIDGQLWGVNESWRDDGGNDYFIIEDDAILKTATSGTQELYTNARKWQATSSGLFYGDGKVSIGSTTDTRLFNIVAPEEVGARFRDMTNDVTMDMRVEDFQAFIGTFSNHQMRFQTNNLSRLTIDIDGDIGIGTTSPSSKLTVAGVITPDANNTFSLGNSTYRWSEVFATNGTINTSDRRQKDNITSLQYGLDELLSLEPVSFVWKDYPEDGTKFGLIAQEVQEILPEIIHEGDDVEKTLGIRYTELIAIVINAIKELWQSDEELRQENNALRERLEAVEAKLDMEMSETEPSNGSPSPAPASNQAESNVGSDNSEIEISATSTKNTNTSSSTATSSTDVFDEESLLTETQEFSEPAENEADNTELSEPEKEAELADTEVEPVPPAVIEEEVQVEPTEQEVTE